VVSLGPVTANVLAALDDASLAGKVNVYTAMTLPVDLKPELARQWTGKPLVVVEEHVSIGGLAQQLAVPLMEQGVAPSRFVSLHAQGYPNGLYGDQKYHQQLSGLDPASIRATLTTLLQP
jgi:transketolase